MPVTCCRMARPMPTSRGLRSRPENKSPHVPCPTSSPALMLENSAAANSRPPTRSSISRLSFSRPRSSSQRGLSGIRNSSSAKTTEGAIPVANIHRQPVAVSQACTSGVAGSPFAWAIM